MLGNMVAVEFQKDGHALTLTTSLCTDTRDLTTMNTSTKSSRLIPFLLVSFAICLNASAQSWSGNDIGNSQNWSDGLNWAGNVAPGSGGAVLFPDGTYPVTTNAQGVVNNIVQSSTTISSLTYNNNGTSNKFVTTQIPLGVVLTVNGNVTVGGTFGAFATITGGGSLIAGTGASTLTVQNTNSTTLDLSPLSTFVFNAGGSGGPINLSTGSSSMTGKINLAGTSNNITATTLSLGNNNNGGTGTMNLGNGTNIINADTISMGIDKTTGTMQFLNNAGGGLKIASHTGTGRANINLSGQSGSGSTSANINGSMLFNGGTVNILANNLIVGNRGNRAQSGGNGSATGVLQFNNGLVDATTIIMATNSGSAARVNGTLSVGGPGVLRVGTGGIILVNQGASSNAVGTLNITNGAIAVVTNSIYKGTSAGSGTVVVASSSLSVFGTIGAINSVPIDNFNITNSTLTLAANSSASVLVNAFNPDATTQNTVNIDSMPAITSYPAQFPLISYQTPGGNLNSLVLGTLPGLPGTFLGYISNNATALSIDLVVTNGPVAKADLWSGAANTLWDTTTLNWTTGGLATNYNDLDQVTFDDTATTGNVNVTGTRTPATVNGLTFNNNSTNYVFTGTGKISGAASLVKNGTASTTLSETGGDNFSGGIAVNNGTLVLDNANSAISGGLTISGGTTVQIGNNDGAGVLPSGTLDNGGTLVFDRNNSLTVGTVIPGVGNLIQNGSGTLTLTANNSYSGNTTVNAGTLALSGSGAIASSPLVGVTNATLDVSGVTAASGVTTLQALNLSNAIVNVEAGYLRTNLIISGALTDSGTSNVINVKSLPPIAFYPATNVLIQAGSIANYNFALGTLPAGSPAFGGNISESADQTLVLLVLTNGPIGIRSTVTWSGVDASGSVNTNWSDAQNWASPGAPVIGERVAFNNTAVASSSVFSAPGEGSGGIVNPGNINNIVDVNSTNAGLNYANGSTHNTLINPGKKLLVNGSLTVNGSSGTATIFGSGASLTISNTANTSVLNVDNSSVPTLDLSGLDTLAATVSQVGVGFNSASQGSGVSGILYLAKTNTILTPNGSSGVNSTIVVGGSTTQNSSGTGTLYLGQTNALFVDGIVLGIGPSSNNLVAFNPAVTNNNPTAYIRGILGGASRVTQWALGDASANVNNNSGGSGDVVDLTGGTINALVNTLIVGQGAQGNEFTTNIIGTFNMGAGILDVTTLTIGVGDNGKTGGTGIGIMNVTGGTVIANAVNMGINTPTNTQGTFNLTNATLVLSNGITVGPSAAGGTLSVIGSQAKLLSGGIGSPFAPMTTLNLDTARLQLVADGAAPQANIAAGTVNATNLTTINLAVITNVVGTAQIQLISYANFALDPYTNLVLGTVPAGYTVGNSGALVDNTGNQSIDIILTAASGPSTNANITHVSLSGTNLLIHGTNNNVPNTSFHYAVLTATNLLTPLSNWTVLSTNIPFNPDGTFDYTNPIVPGTPRQFIDVKAVP
jgi:autotransporter-associated beta strand protein